VKQYIHIFPQVVNIKDLRSFLHLMSSKPTVKVLACVCKETRQKGVQRGRFSTLSFNSTVVVFHVNIWTVCGTELTKGAFCLLSSQSSAHITFEKYVDGIRSPLLA